MYMNFLKYKNFSTELFLNFLSSRGVLLSCKPFSYKRAYTSFSADSAQLLVDSSTRWTCKDAALIKGP